MYGNSATLHQQPANPMESESFLDSCDLNPIEPVHVRLTTYARHSSPSPLRLQPQESPLAAAPPQLTPQSPMTPSRQPRPRVPRSRLVNDCRTPPRLGNKVQYLMRSQTRCSSPSPLTLMNIHQEARYLTRSRVRMWKQNKKQPCPVHGKIIRRQLPRRQSTPKLLQGRTNSHHQPAQGGARQDLFPNDVKPDARCAGKYVSTPDRMRTKGKKQREKGFVTRIRSFASRLQSRFSKAVSRKQTVDVTDFSNVQQASDVQWVELNSRKKQNYFSGSTEELDSSLPITCFRAKKVKVTKSNPAKSHIKRLMKVKQQRSLSTPARAKRLSMLQSTSQVPLLRPRDSSTASTTSSQQDTSGTAQNPSSRASAHDQHTFATATEPLSPVLPPQHPTMPEEPKVPPIIIKKTAVMTTVPCLVTEKVPPIVIRRTNMVINPLVPQQESDLESSELTDTTHADSFSGSQDNSDTSDNQQPAPCYAEPRPRDYRWISPLVQSKVERILEKSTADASQNMPFPSRLPPLGISQTLPETQAAPQGPSKTKLPQPAPDVSTPGHMKSATSKLKVPVSSTTVSDKSTTATSARLEGGATKGKIGSHAQPLQPSVTATATRPGAAVSKGPQQQATNQPVQVVPHTNLTTKEQAANFLRYFHKFGQTRRQLKSLVAKTLSLQVVHPETLQIIFSYFAKKSLLTDNDVLMIKLYIREKWKMQQGSNKEHVYSAPTKMGSSTGLSSKSSASQSIPTKTMPLRESTHSAQTVPAQHMPGLASKPHSASTTTGTTPTPTARPLPARIQMVQEADRKVPTPLSSSRIMPQYSSSEASHPRKLMTSVPASTQSSQHTPTTQLTQPVQSKQTSTLAPTPVQDMQRSTSTCQQPAPTVQRIGQLQPRSLLTPTSGLDLSAPASRVPSAPQDPRLKQKTRIPGSSPSEATQHTAVNRQLSTTAQISTQSVSVPTSIQIPNQGVQMSTSTTPVISVPNQGLSAPIPANSQQMSASHQQSSAPQKLMSQISTPQISVPYQPLSAAHQQKPTQQISAPHQPMKEAQRQKSVPQISLSQISKPILPSTNLAKQMPEPTAQISKPSPSLTSTTWRISAPILLVTKPTLPVSQSTAPTNTYKMPPSPAPASGLSSNTSMCSSIQSPTALPEMSSPPADPISITGPQPLQTSIQFTVPVNVHPSSGLSSNTSDCQSIPSPTALPEMSSFPTEPISDTVPQPHQSSIQLTVPLNPPPPQDQTDGRDKSSTAVGMVIPSILSHRVESSLHDDIQDMDTLPASTSRKRLFPDSHQSEDTNMQPLKKSRFSYTDLLAENRAWVWSSIKSRPEDCKQCDGINEILHDTPHYLDKYWTVRPTERSPEKNWQHVYPSLCQQTAGKPHLLAKELVWRLFTIEQLYGNRFHTLDESITSKICFIVMYETSCGVDYWRKKCVPFINSSIRRLFNDKLRKYEHLLNHTCAPKETTPSVPNTCTAILPYRF